MFNESLHKTTSFGLLIVGIGLIFKVKGSVSPLHSLPRLAINGTTFTKEVEEIEVELFTDLNGAILPFPLADKPIFVFELNHLNVVVGVVLSKFLILIESLWQTTKFCNAVTLGLGFTVILNLTVSPLHIATLLYSGIIEIIAVFGKVLEFLALNFEINKPLFEAKPIVGSEEIQL